MRAVRLERARLTGLQRPWAGLITELGYRDKGGVWKMTQLKGKQSERREELPYPVEEHPAILTRPGNAGQPSTQNACCTMAILCRFQSLRLGQSLEFERHGLKLCKQDPCSRALAWGQEKGGAEISGFEGSFEHSASPERDHNLSARNF